jgi:hypothetical protein
MISNECFVEIRKMVKNNHDFIENGIPSIGSITSFSSMVNFKDYFHSSFYIHYSIEDETKNNPCVSFTCDNYEKYTQMQKFLNEKLLNKGQEK